MLLANYYHKTNLSPKQLLIVALAVMLNNGSSQAKMSKIHLPTAIVNALRSDRPMRLVAVSTRSRVAIAGSKHIWIINLENTSLLKISPKQQIDRLAFSEMHDTLLFFGNNTRFQAIDIETGRMVIPHHKGAQSRWQVTSHKLLINAQERMPTRLGSSEGEPQFQGIILDTKNKEFLYFHKFSIHRYSEDYRLLEIIRLPRRQQTNILSSPNNNKIGLISQSGSLFYLTDNHELQQVTKIPGWTGTKLSTQFAFNKKILVVLRKDSVQLWNL